MVGTAPASAQSLGTAHSYGVLGGSGVTAAGGAGTIISGDVGSSPTASVTGFPPAVVTAGFTVHPTNDASNISAQAAAGALYTSLSTGACTTNPGPALSGANFGPGIHCFSSTADLAVNSTFTLTGAGVYIFRVGSALNALSGSSVTLAGADPCNVFWQVTSAATLNGASFAGNVIAQAGVSLGPSASVTGRTFATTAGPVTLAGSNTVGGCSAPAAPVCPAITLTPPTMPNGTVGVAYSQTILGNGGAPPYSFTVTSGTLPAGLTLTSAGVLAGTPTTAGTSTFTVQGTDTNGCLGTIAYTIIIAAAPPVPPVCPTITLSPSTLPNGTVGVAYSQTILGSGGTAPYSFGVTSGTLPPGLTLTPAGVLAGTPTTAGSSTFTIRGTDANGCFAEITYTIVVAAAPPVPPVCPVVTVSPPALPNGTVGVAYSQTILASGGTAPYIFGVTSGALPPGLTLTSAGVLAGTPTTAGTTTFTVQATDANGCIGLSTYTMIIAAAPAPPPGCPVITLSPATLPNGTVGVAYSQTISASGGTGPYSFGVTSGVLPPGLTLTPAGLLAGTPTLAGTSIVTIRGTDANGCFASITYTIIIAAAPPVPPGCPVITLSPSTLPNAVLGIAYTQTLTGSGGTGPYSFGVTSGALPPGITLTAAGVLAGTPTVSGTSAFVIRGTDANGCFAEISFTLVVAATAVPTLPQMFVLLLAVGLTALGYVRLRRRARMG